MSLIASVRNTGLLRTFCTGLLNSTPRFIRPSSFVQPTVYYARGLYTSAAFRRSLHENPRNEEIKAKTVLLLDRDGDNLGNMPLVKAQNKAKEDSLELVQIQRQKGTSPAICKLVSSRTLYELEKKGKSKQGSKTKVLKITGRIAPQDLVWKSKKIRDFLDHGHFVKVLITRKPYQKISVSEKMEIVSKIKEDVKDVGMLDGYPKEIGALAVTCKFKPIVQNSKAE